MGLFDAIGGIFRSGADFVTDFGGGIFTAVDERFRSEAGSVSSGGGGGGLSQGEFQGPSINPRTGARLDPLPVRLGAKVGNLFGDIGESLISAAIESVVPVPTGQKRSNAGVVTTQTVSTASGAGRGGAPARSGTGKPAASAQNVPLDIELQTAGIGAGAPLLDLLPGLSDIVVGAGEAVSRAVTTGVGNIEQFFGVDVPLLGPGSFTDIGGSGVAQALPGGAIISASGRAGISPMMRTTSRLPAQVTFVVPTPSGGSRIVAYRNMGRPILWSGDLAAVKRVARARRRVGRGRPR